MISPTSVKLFLRIIYIKKLFHFSPTHNDEMCNFYFMYYTKIGEVSNALHCYGNNNPQLARQMPADSDVPLPPNPLLDHVHGQHHVEVDAGAHEVENAATMDKLPGTSSSRRLASLPRMAGDGGYWQQPEDYGDGGRGYVPPPFYYDYGDYVGGWGDADDDVENGGAGSYFYQVANQRKRNRNQYGGDQHPLAQLPVQPSSRYRGAAIENGYGGDGAGYTNPSSRSQGGSLPRTKYTHRDDPRKYQDSFQDHSHISHDVKAVEPSDSGESEESQPQLVSFANRKQGRPDANQGVNQPQITNQHAHKLRHDKSLRKLVGLATRVVPGWPWYQHECCLYFFPLSSNNNIVILFSRIISI